VNAILSVSALWCALSWAVTDDSYFPVRTKAEDEGVTAFEAQWYGKSLERMNEPRLRRLAEDVNAEVYRILILPTWGNSIVVRVHRHEKRFRLVSRRLDGQAGYDPGKLAESKYVELKEDDSRALETLIRNLNFFDFSPDDGVLGADGDEWILEGVAQGKYHVAKRWCASTESLDKRGLTAFLALCRFLLDKSSLSERPKNKGHKLI
jgi:hypothetical protein